MGKEAIDLTQTKAVRDLAHPWHGHHYLRVSARHGKNPAKSSVARKLLIAAWHMLSRDEPFKPPASINGGENNAPASSCCFLTA